MSDLSERLADYGLTLDANIVICDRRVVDEAVAALAASPTPSLPEDVARVVEVLNDTLRFNRVSGPTRLTAAALIQSLSSQLAETRALLDRKVNEKIAEVQARKAAEADRDRLAAENERLREALEPFAGDKLPTSKRVKIAYNRHGLRCAMSDLEIARDAARTALASLEDRA